MDVEAVREAATRLLEMGCEALAIVFINAYANPANERAALEAARRIWPNAHLGHSAQVLPEIRQFDSTPSLTHI